MSEQVDAEIARATRQVADTSQRVAARVAASGPVTGQASSTDGALTVAVAPGGALRELEIGPAALNMGPEALAEEILRLADRATRLAGARLHESVRGVLDPPAVQALTDLGMPAEDADRVQSDDEQDNELDTVLWRNA